MAAPILFIAVSLSACDFGCDSRPGEAGTLRDMLERARRDSQGTRPSVYAGELPPGYPLPLPEGAEVVGGIAREDPPAFQAKYEVYLDLDDSSETAVAVIRSVLSSQDWHPPENSPGAGEMPPGREGVFEILCRAEEHLVVTAFPGNEDGTSEVSVAGPVSSDQSPCATGSMEPEGG
ncbi:MAG: hypothetical protein ACOC5K_02585 [Chloroflexota bacterium]